MKTKNLKNTRQDKRSADLKSKDRQISNLARRLKTQLKTVNRMRKAEAAHVVCEASLLSELTDVKSSLLLCLHRLTTLSSAFRKSSGTVLHSSEIGLSVTDPRAVRVQKASQRYTEKYG